MYNVKEDDGQRKAEGDSKKKSDVILDSAYGAFFGAIVGGFASLFADAYHMLHPAGELGRAMDTDLTPQLINIIDKNTPLSTNISKEIVDIVGNEYGGELSSKISDGIFTNSDAQELSRYLIDGHSFSKGVCDYLNAASCNASELSMKLTNAFTDFATNHSDTIRQYAQAVATEPHLLNWILGGAVIGATIMNSERIYDEIRKIWKGNE